MTTSPPDRKVLNQALERAKLSMFTYGKGMPWIWDIISSFDIIWSSLNHTAWVDGITVGLNPTYFMKLPRASRVTLLAHLADHVMRDHNGRRGDRERQVWNWAGDYVINLELEEQGFTFDGMTDVLIDYRYADMATEQVYDLLMKDPAECARIAAFMWPSNMSSRDDENYDPGSPNIPDLSADLFEELPGTRSRVVQKVLHAREMAISHGMEINLPAEVRGMVSGYTNPRLKWDQILSRFYTALGDEDYSWSKPSRRHTTEYMPSLLVQDGLDELLYFFDISGSVTLGQIKTAIGQLRSLHKTVRPAKITLVLFDTTIIKTLDFYREDEIGEIEIQGGGGTYLAQVYEMIVEKQPVAAVIFSDMLVQMMPNPGVPIVWVCLDNRGWQPPNYGQVIHLDTEDLE